MLPIDARAYPRGRRQRGAGTRGRACRRAWPICALWKRRANGSRARATPCPSCSWPMRTSSSAWRSCAPCAASGRGSSRPAASSRSRSACIAETAWRMTTRRDPWVNMLRTTVAAFSAGIGGADGDHGAAVHGGARPARCLRAPHRAQHATDPARGIQSRARRRSGGRCGRLRGADRCALRESLGAVPGDRARGRHPGEPDGRQLQARIAAVRAQREKAVATRKEPITGTSEFPNIGEAEVSVLFAAPNKPPSPLWGGDGGGGVSDRLSARAPTTPTPPHKGEGALLHRSPALHPYGRALRAPARSRGCPFAQRPAPGQGSSSPISARSRPSRRAPPSPRISSRPEE